MDALRQRAALQRIARLAMLARGFLPDFSGAALAEVDRMADPPAGREKPARNLRNLPWASIDNDDSRDLDQLTVAQTPPGGTVKILVAVADVDALVKKSSAIDGHARQKGTWVRLPNPPVEGRLIQGHEGADVGHRIRVQLVRTDVDRGYIDFKRVE